MEFFQVFSLMDSFREKPDSLEKFKKKLDYYLKLEAETLTKIGMIYFEDEQIPEARANFKEALNIYQKMRYLEGEAYIRDLIGDTYIDERNIDKALQYYQESFKIYSNIKSSYKKELFEKIKDAERVKEAIDLLKE